MAYDEYLADRIRHTLQSKKVVFEEKKMMGGLCFMVDDKMCVGTSMNKVSGQPQLVARIGEEVYEESLTRKGCRKFDITGREMKGFVYVEEEGIDSHEALTHWVQLSLNYNPKAKSSKKKK